MKITVAGAGAGKTTSMAKTVLSRYKQIDSKKFIYVVTYTNAARDKIREKFIEENGYIPKQIHVETYHSFLLREFIFPFHHILYEDQYVEVSQIPLPSQQSHKNYKINQLKNSKQIHVEKVTEVAKWIVYGKSADKRIHKEKRNKILSIILNYLDSIYIDEAQDMDGHLSKIMETLDRKTFYVALIGDPKQDLRGRNAFRELIERYSENVTFNTDNHRCPISHVNLTNQFVVLKERQIPRSNIQGALKYLYETDVEIENIILKNVLDYVYISRKNDRFITNVTDINIPLKKLSYELNQIILNSHLKNDKKLNLFSYYAQQICLESIHMENSMIFKKIEKYLELTLTKSHMGKLETALESNREVESFSGIKVNSIDSVKGLEGNRCMFIVTTDIVPYLLGENTTINKTKNYLYVALTRAREELTLLITKEVEYKYGRDFLSEKLSSLNIDLMMKLE